MLLGAGIISPLKNMLPALLSGHLCMSPTSCVTSGRPLPLSRPYVLQAGMGAFSGFPVWTFCGARMPRAAGLAGDRSSDPFFLKPALAQVTSQVVN